MKKIRFYCPNHIEEWDWRSLDTTGIGGSETHVVEVSERLAAKGHDVAVYAPLPEDCPAENCGVAWRKLEDLDPTEDALWLLQRCPDQLLKHDWKGPVVLHLHDIVKPMFWDPEWNKRPDMVLCQSKMHGAQVERMFPELSGRMGWVGSGARVELFEKIEREEGIERSPHRLIWASDPSRGLGAALLPLWPIIRRHVPLAELHIFYGWDVMDAIIARRAPHERLELKQAKADTMELVDQRGVYWRGRVSQEQLYREYLGAGVWPYWTDFPETCCIAALEAQCGGTIPITTAVMALVENVQHGVMIQGRAGKSARCQDELLEATIFMLLNQDVEVENTSIAPTRAGHCTTMPAQDAYRMQMIPEARARCSWDAVMERWEGALI